MDRSEILEKYGTQGVSGTTGPIGVAGTPGIPDNLWSYVLNKKQQFLPDENLEKLSSWETYKKVIEKYNLNGLPNDEILGKLREETIKILNK
jgi:hypothetical protein